ncbi:MAG TPA: aspartyl/asparaginyl beta-hydroxylase domain-containing protein [Bacteroidia bacterium]|jgi:aspartyl/asparaginyl beta-hydroxylase (cupin superfamily)|nr:aspartyl/asparaginyl beta-hydroxylase domain-containing protein [Bacteroidia bacterium]
MPESKSHIWYASSMRPYPGNEPWFFDTKSCPPLAEMESHWAQLKDEIAAFVKEKDSKFVSNKEVYENIDINNGWSVLVFLFWGLKISNEFKKKCPQTYRYIKKVPGFVSLSISQLSPHSTLAEHTGDTNAMLRCHLGVEIPGRLPDCGLIVNGDKKNWEEGKWIIFNDAYQHGAWNNTDKRRIVIIMDFIKPEFIGQKNLACAFILTRHVSYIYHKVKLIAKMPVFMKTILFGFILGIIYVLKPVYNLFKIG